MVAGLEFNAGWKIVLVEWHGRRQTVYTGLNSCGGTSDSIPIKREGQLAYKKVLKYYR